MRAENRELGKKNLRVLTRDVENAEIEQTAGVISL